MQFQYHLALIQRHWKAILAAIILSGLAFGLYGWTANGKPFEGTLFLSIGSNAIMGFSAGSSYDNAQAADAFTETIQGWFKNPGLTQRIEDKAGETIGLGAKRQEKQNLVVTFAASSEQKVSGISKIILNELEKDIIQYNSATGSEFKIALGSLDTGVSGIKKNLFAVAGILLGILAGIAYAYKIEYVSGKISFPEKVSLALGEKTDAVLRRNKQELLTFVNAYLEKEGYKNINILCLTDFVKKKVGDWGKNTIWGYPEGVTEMVKHRKEPLLLICELGKTTTHDLSAVKPLLPEKMIVITLY